MTTDNFEIKIYSWQELGLFYSPGLNPLSAAKRIKRWIYSDEKLMQELTGFGFKKGNRLLTPLQVETIVRHLGEPLRTDFTETINRPHNNSY